MNLGVGVCVGRWCLDDGGGGAIGLFWSDSEVELRVVEWQGSMPAYLIFRPLGDQDPTDS